MAAKSVLFPEPFAPVIAVIDAAGMEAEKSLIISRFPRKTERCEISIIARHLPRA
jgi:hypothetical protein